MCQLIATGIAEHNAVPRPVMSNVDRLRSFESQKRFETRISGRIKHRNNERTRLTRVLKQKRHAEDCYLTSICCSVEQVVDVAEREVWKQESIWGRSGKLRV